MGGTRSENWWGCAAGHWKLDPKRSREKLNLGPKRSNPVRIGSFNTPKDRFGVGGGEKIPQKDRVQSSECQKRGSKRGHIHITQHRGSTLPELLQHLATRGTYSSGDWRCDEAWREQTLVYPPVMCQQRLIYCTWELNVMSVVKIAQPSNLKILQSPIANIHKFSKI